MFVSRIVVFTALPSSLRTSRLISRLLFDSDHPILGRWCRRSTYAHAVNLLICVLAALVKAGTGIENALTYTRWYAVLLLFSFSPVRRVTAVASYLCIHVSRDGCAFVHL